MSRPIYPWGRDRAPIVCEAGWVRVLQPVWTDVDNLAVTGIRSLECPALSKCLYRLSYRGPLVCVCVCVCVALVIQHAMRLRFIVICGMSGCAILFHIIS